jgi:hypothetical protein
MIERSLEVPLSNARSFKLGQLYVTQSLSDFRNDDTDMTRKILTNTSLKVFMNASDPDVRDYLRDISGEVTERMRSSSHSSTDTPAGKSISESEGEHEVLLDRLRSEHLNRVNAHADLGIVLASPMVGFTRLMHPAICEIPFSMSRTEYDGFEELGWPAPDGVSTLCGRDITRPAPAPDPTPAPEPPAPAPADQQKRRRKPKPPDPEQQQRSAELAERLRRMRGQT